MTLFGMKRLVLENFRCFAALDLALEDDLTVLFAENGGGKTVLLSALAMGLSATRVRQRRMKRRRTYDA